MSKSSPTRREFAATAAALAAAPLAADEPAPRRTVAEALADVIRLRHGNHLNADQLRRLRVQVQSYLDSAERLRRRFPCTGGAEPAHVFSADLP